MSIYLKRCFFSLPIYLVSFAFCRFFICVTLLVMLFNSAHIMASSNVHDSSEIYYAPWVSSAPLLDGVDSQDTWRAAPWQAINHLTVGSMPKANDFSGRYKLVWTDERLYLLAEITDDILIDTHVNPLEQYWDDDALEIFVDEDASGGRHQFNYNAFAYHLSLDNQAVDIGPFKSKEDEQAGRTFVRTYPKHVSSHWKRRADAPHTVVWEVSIALYPDTFKDRYAKGEHHIKAVKLVSGKEFGFMVAYCDADSPAGREHFLGSHDIKAVNGDKNRGYIDASVFGRVKLIKAAQ